MRMVSYKLYQRLRILPTNWPISTLDADACYWLMVLLMLRVFIVGIYVVRKFLELKKYYWCISWKEFPIFSRYSLLSHHLLAWYIHGIEKCTSLQRFPMNITSDEKFQVHCRSWYPMNVLIFSSELMRCYIIVIVNSYMRYDWN